MDIPDFFKELVRQKQISNASAEDLNHYFPVKDVDSIYIPLNQYPCICLGYRNKVKTCVRFSFLKCEDKPLNGRHLLLYEGEEMMVDSMTNFKKEILRLEDHVSFDRCTFILLEKEKRVFRLNLIRNRLQLPLFSGGLSYVECPQSNSLHVKVVERNKEDVCDVFKGYLTDVYTTVMASDNLGDEEERRAYYQQFLENLFSHGVDLLYQQDMSQEYEDCDQEDPFFKMINSIAETWEEDSQIEL